MAACAIHIAAIAPLAYVSEPVIARNFRAASTRLPRAGFLAVRQRTADYGQLGDAWSVIMFRARGARFDAFGGLLAAAALAGALSGLVLGRFIDAGHARRLTW